MGNERAEAEVAVEQAWSELAGVEREQEAARAERDRVERQLEQVRLRGAQLEQVGRWGGRGYEQINTKKSKTKESE